MEEGEGQQGTFEGTYIASNPVLPYHARNCLHLAQQLHLLQQHEKFCDIVFEIHGRAIPAHRAVVGAWSPYLLSLLHSRPAIREVARVNYDNYEIFSDMVSFMYTGKIDLRDTNLIQLLHLATSFQVEALREVCEGTLRCNLHEGNIVSTFYVARKFKLSRLEEFSLTYLQMHLPEAVKQLDFLHQAATQFNMFLRTGLVVHLKPEVKLFLIISWLGYDVRDREQFLVALLQHIDWSTVAGDFLQEISQTENFFTTNESSLYLLLQTLHSSGISLGAYVEVFPSLREKHSHLLSQVVQNCVLDISPEEYYPVSVTVSMDTTQHSEVVNPPNVTESKQGEGHASNDGSDLSQVKVHSVVTETPAPTQSKVTTRGRKRRETMATDFHSPSTGQRMNTRNTSRMRSKELEEPTVLFVESEKDSQSNHIDGSKDDEDEEDVYGFEDDDTNDPDFIQPEAEENLFAMETEPEKRAVKKPASRPTSKKKTLKCSDCDYATSSGSRLNEHRSKLHLNVPEKTFDCHVCDFTSTWNKKFYAHMKEHYYGPPYHCKHDGCEYTADTIRNILIHRVRHTDERPFPCDQCSLRFRTRSNLYAHRKCHLGRKPWKCEVCGQCFATKYTLGQHSVRHSDDRPYLCDLCGFGTKYQSHLISHKRIHTGDVFRCHFAQCSYSTPKRSALKGHMRTHFGVRKYSCSSCSKTFVEKSHLVRHEKIHLDVRPFSCTECSYSTHRRDKLKEHVQKRHDNNSSSTPSSADKPKKPKKNRKRDVKLEPKETASMATNTEGQRSDEAANQMYPQIVQNTQYINTLEPVVMDTTQNMVMHGSEGQGHMMTSAPLGHQQLHQVSAPVEHQQVTVVMDARVHAHINRGILVDPLSQSGSIPTPADGSIVYAVPATTPQTVVMTTPQQQDYNNIGSYYSFVMNNEGQ